MYMLRHLFLFSALIVGMNFAVLGQTSQKYSGEYADFYRAEELFDKEQYSAARKVFREFINANNNPEDPLYVKALYYEGRSALELFNNDAVQLLSEFNNNYPENIYKNEIYFRIGQYFYQNKKYVDASQWLEKTDVRSLDTAFVAEYHFKLGYAHFQLGNFTEARNSFFEVKDTKSNYAAPATYYFSHIAYQNKSYQVALEGFLTLLENDAFKAEVPYYITQIYYLMGNYDEVIKFAPSSVDSLKTGTSAEMYRLIGDAYYRVGMYDEAIVYLEDYNKRSKTSREDDYQLGYAYYKVGYCDKAIRQFDRVSRTKDKLGQVALYHIAECYLKMNDLNKARMAFGAAAELDYDAAVQEDALYNYAVMWYKVDYNPYNEAIKAFELFLEKYPNSKRKADVYEYLVNVYSSTKKYKEALASLDKLPSLDVKLKTAYQIIAFNMGVEEYERAQYKKAITAFDLVKKHNVDPKVNGKAVFWKADALYMLKDYNESIKTYREFLSIPGNYTSEIKNAAYYNIAYAYYEKKDLIQAIQEFRTYTQLANNNDKAKLADAYARIGDAYYSDEQNPDYEKAVLNYQNSIDLKQGNVDQTLFYLAQAYGYIPGKSSLKISTLLDVINNHKGSKYMIRSIYEVGLIYKYENNLEKGLQYFEQIVKDYPNNIKVREALIEIADIKYKQKKYTESESYFNRVLNEFTLDDETCQRATNGLRDIFLATRQTERINEIRTKYPCANISQDDEENFYFSSANELYVKEKYDEAIPEINKYLASYPNGRFVIQLKSYLADIYYQRDQKGQALVLYEQIIDAPVSAFTEEALVRASKTLYNDGAYMRALPHYNKLESLASTPQVIYNTRVGLMRCNYLLEFFPNATSAAQKVISDQLINETVQLEAYYIAGMSLYKTKKYNEALPYLSWTEKNTGTERGTEALHFLAYSNFYLDNYTEVEKLHNQLLSRKPAYDYWIAHSLLLKGKLLMVLDDLFAAEQTVQLVINNYPNKEDGVIADAEKLLAEIMQLKNQPKSLNDDGGRTIDFEEGGNNE
jgi:tetratricopeptide (TPR) repeat protein